jgi:chemotaxis signal transduction protein
VILLETITASPGRPHCVKGIINLRDVVLPLIDLHLYLNIDPVDTDPRNHRIVVTEFNGNHASFQVEAVDQIYRMSWQQISPVPKADVGQHFSVTGITEINDELVLMLDFESMLRSHLDAGQAACRTCRKPAGRRPRSTTRHVG